MTCKEEGVELSPLHQHEPSSMAENVRIQEGRLGLSLSGRSAIYQPLTPNDRSVQASAARLYVWNGTLSCHETPGLATGSKVGLGLDDFNPFYTFEITKLVEYDALYCTACTVKIVRLVYSKTSGMLGAVKNFAIILKVCRVGELQRAR